jgi:hypothetical protein
VSEEAQQEEVETSRPDTEVPTEDATTLPSKALVNDAIEWKRQWRELEGNPPNAYADDLLLMLAEAYVAGALIFEGSDRKDE